MGILKLNRILILGTFLLFFNCKEVHKKPKGYCNKYISGGMPINLFFVDSITENEFKSIKIQSSAQNKLKYFEKKVKHRSLIIQDTLLLTDTLFLNFRDKTYKLHSFKNGPIEVFTSDKNWKKKQENCFLQRMNLNGKIIKREWDLTFKIEL